MFQDLQHTEDFKNSSRRIKIQDYRLKTFKIIKINTLKTRKAIEAFNIQNLL